MQWGGIWVCAALAGAHGASAGEIRDLIDVWQAQGVTGFALRSSLAAEGRFGGLVAEARHALVEELQAVKNENYLLNMQVAAEHTYLGTCTVVGAAMCTTGCTPSAH